MVERESTDTMIPSLNLKAKVVVPFANLMFWLASFAPDAEAKLFLQKWAGSATLGTSKAPGIPNTISVGHNDAVPLDTMARLF
mmetsp:Transcript_29789/g.34605  ORF Transcript_29789/g.34605 Transcript_29789/m.34605 type:complete len:83 (+) Transcript_29789:773-1021(+)